MFMGKIYILAYIGCGVVASGCCDEEISFITQLGWQVQPSVGIIIIMCLYQGVDFGESRTQTLIEMGCWLDTDNSVRYPASVSCNNVALYANDGKRFGRVRSLRGRIFGTHASFILIQYTLFVLLRLWTGRPWYIYWLMDEKNLEGKEQFVDKGEDGKYCEV